MAQPDDEEDKLEYFCARVGELILLSSVLDTQLNSALVKLHFTNEEDMLRPLIAEIDSRAKLEIIKGALKHYSADHWVKPIKKWVTNVEKCMSYRNTVAHHVLAMQDGEFVLHSEQSRKIFKTIRDGKALPLKSVNDVCAWIEKTKSTIKDGNNVVANLAEFQKQVKKKNP